MSGGAGTVIVGGGQAGAEAAFALRSAGYQEPITLVCAEAHLPYERPPLSKGVLDGRTDPAKLLLRSAGAYEAKSIDVRLRAAVTGIDRAAHRVHLETGEALPYASLILATGADAVRPPWARSDRIHTIRTLDDALRIAPRPTDRVAVIGGSFLGLEVASSLSSSVASVTVLESADQVLPGRVSACTAERVRALHESRGIRFVLGELVSGVADVPDDSATGSSSLRIELSDGTELGVDWAVLSIGARPRDELARDCGIDTWTRGVLVDDRSRTSDPDIYAIGDVAVMRSADGAAVGVESVASAMAQARAAAAAIVGAEPPARRPETFWSEQFGRQLRIAGVVPERDSDDIVHETEDGGFVVRRSCDGELVCIEAFGSPREYALGLRELTTHH